MKYISCLLLLLSSLLFFCGCNKNQENNIVGKWQEVNNPKGALEFRSDHTGHAYWPDESGKQDSSEMKWEILNGGSRVAVITAPGPVNFEIKRDQLVAPNGVILKKIK